MFLQKIFSHKMFTLILISCVLLALLVGFLYQKRVKATEIQASQNNGAFDVEYLAAIQGDWAVEHVEGIGSDLFVKDMVLSISEEKLSGYGTCRTFYGSISAHNQRVSIGSLEVDRISATAEPICSDTDLDTEREYFEILNKIDDYNMGENKTLTFTSMGETVLRAVPYKGKGK